MPPSILSQITISKYRSLRDVTIKMDGFNILFGEDGSGKSSILSALHLVRNAWPKSPSGPNMQLTFNDALSYSGSLIPNKKVRSLAVRQNDAPDFLDKIWIYQFDPRSLLTDLRPENNMRLEFDGSNLAPFMHRLREQQEKFPESSEAKSWNLIAGVIRLIVPHFGAIFTNLTERRVKLYWQDRTGQIFTARKLPSHILQAIASVVALAQPAVSGQIFLGIDDLGIGLSCRQMRMLVSLARSTSTRHQVLFTTNTLDWASSEEINMVGRDRRGTFVHRMEHLSLDTWLEDYSFAELADKGILTPSRLGGS